MTQFKASPVSTCSQEAVNSGDNSHLVIVPAGTILSDSLYNTPLFQGEGHAGFGNAAPDNPADGDVSHPPDKSIYKVLVIFLSSWA